MIDDVWAAYLTTHLDLTLPSGDVRRLEQCDGASEQSWPFEQDHAWIMTACNPRSQLLSDAVNAERHELLRVQIEQSGYDALPNVGFDPLDPRWREQGFTIAGISEAEACTLAETWEQNAVFGWWPDRWELVGVLMGGRTTRHWRWID